MIVNVNQCASMFDETLHVFKFSAIASQVICSLVSQTTKLKQNSCSETSFIVILQQKLSQQLFLSKFKDIKLNKNTSDFKNASSFGDHFMKKHNLMTSRLLLWLVNSCQNGSYSQRKEYVL